MTDTPVPRADAGSPDGPPAPAAFVRRFRFTLLAVCGLLVVLGGIDALEALQNRAPETVRIEALEDREPPQRWLTIQGGVVDLAQAISTSGTLELEALLVPLQAPGAQGPLRVLVETRDSRALALFRTLHFGLDTLPEQAAFEGEHADELRGRRNYTGMILGGLGARANRGKLRELARTAGLEVADDVIFFIEDKTPAPVRGFAFLGLGLAGILRLAWPARGRWGRARRGPPEDR